MSQVHAQPPPPGGAHKTLAPEPVRRERAIGAILIDAGRLTIADAERVLHAARRFGLRFGEAAVKLGVLTPEDIRFALSRQYDFPYLGPSGDKLSDELVAAYRPLSPQTESIRALRSQLLLHWLGEEPKRRCVALVSAGRREGRSRLAANLAIVFAQLGERTLLVDGDLRHPRQHALFHLDNANGLSSALAGRGAPTLYRIGSLGSLSVLPSGPAPPNPQELLSRSNFGYLMNELGGNFDIIILDSPAAEESADAYLIAACAGAAVPVVRRNVTRYPKLQRLADRLASARATVIGSVFNDF
jgi:chain length determinant protein tyrosine kinase EpsG